MADLIERQKFRKKFCISDETIRHMVEEQITYSAFWDLATEIDKTIRDSVLEDIDAEPSVDAVQVVRCKDCKHRSDHHCKKHNISVCLFDYCSYGERREGNGNGQTF